MDSNKKIDEIIDSLFEFSTTKMLLIGIFLLGLFLRLIAAINLGVSADDMHFVTEAIGFISSEKLVTWGMSSGLWHMFTDLMYNLFGFSQLSSRLAAVVFGSLSIIAIYLLAKEFFDEKVALVAAFLLSVAPFHIKSTIADQDLMAMFFTLMAMFLFVRGLKLNKKLPFAISGVFIGLAIYTKVYPLLFIPSLLLYAIFYIRRKQEKFFTKNNLKLAFIFLIVAFIFTVPALTHNYLLYKDKGFLDLQFTRSLGIGKNVSAEFYSWDAQFDSKNSWSGLFLGDTKHASDGSPLLWVAMRFILKGDPTNFLLGFAGLALLLCRKKKNYPLFFILGILFALPFLASIILLSKHYIFLELLLVPSGSFAFISLNQWLKKKLNFNTLKLLVGLIIIFSLFYLGSTITPTTAHFYGKSSLYKAIEFKQDEIGSNELIVMDSRIYRGRIHWMSYGRPYLEGTDFISFLQQQDSLPGNNIQVPVYYFECAIDDCGWGTIKNQPDFNSTMEDLTSFFSQNSKLETVLDEPDRDSYYYYPGFGKRIEVMKVYKVNLNLNEGILQLASQPKNWFLYDIGYEPKEAQFDYYSANSLLEKTLDKLAGYIRIMALIFALISIIFTFFLVLIPAKSF